MVITFKTTSGSIKKFIPTRWEEVTFQQYIDIQAVGDNYVKLLSVFTGLSEEVISRTPFENIDKLVEALSFIYKPMPMDIPDKLMGYTMPKDLGFKTIAQFQDIREDLRIKRTPSEQVLRFPLYCATYALAEYDWRKAEELSKDFMQAPAPEVIAIGNFILRKLVGLRIGKQLNFQARVTPLRRLKLVLKSWLIRLDFTERLSLWRKRVVTSVRKF
jgi:hypothetical protein